MKSELYIGSTPELERLITESIYSNIIDAKLYNEQEYVKIYSSIGRDVLLNDEQDNKYGPNIRVSDLVKGLEAFGQRVDRALDYISEVDSSINKNDTTTETSKEQTPATPGETATKDQESPLGNTRKRKIEIK